MKRYDNYSKKNTQRCDNEGDVRMKEYIIEWANGSEKVMGKDLPSACATIKTPINEIITGFLVRTKVITRKPTYKVSKWAYWDCREFWKALGGRE